MENPTNWKVGDILFWQNPGIDPLTKQEYTPIFRKIAQVRQTGYSWYYPEWDFEAITPGGAENHWWSENSSDPFLETWSLFIEKKLGINFD